MFSQLLVGRHDLSAVDVTRVALGASHGLSSVARHQLVGQHGLRAISQPAAGVAAMLFYLSGGASNSNPDMSLGGPISSTELSFQTYNQSASIPGVSIVRVGNSGLGVGTLRYEVFGDDYVFRWIPKGADEDSGLIISGDGTYGVLSANGIGTGFIVLDIDYSSLSPNTEEAKIDIQNVLPNIFSNVTSANASSGYISHRCLYIKNEHLSKTISGLEISTFKDGNTGSVVEIAADPIGAGDGVSTGVATTPAEETTHPGFSFSSNAQLVDIPPGQTAAFWLRRTIASGWYKDLNPDVHLLLVTGGF